MKELYQKAINLLQELIKIPSTSGEENITADTIQNWLATYNIKTNRNKNNVWAVNKHFDSDKPSILLNSHHDTVQANSGYTINPFDAHIKDGKLFGLGSNDAGGSLVSLLATFVYFYKKENLKYNLVLAATAEEENSGPNSLRSLLSLLPEIDFAIIGEPTEMQLAIAEKGLLVLDGVATGIAGHASHENTDNAIYNAMDDIAWIRSYEFPKTTDLLGKVKMSVTQINAGQQHNLVPPECSFVVDVRLNEAYTNKEVYEIIAANTKSKIKARSFNLNSSSIPLHHPIVKSGISIGRTTYASPTLSDQAALSCVSLKLGPGLSSRSHSADEYIFVNEIEEGIALYIQILLNII